MSQFEDDDDVPPVEDNDEPVPETKFVAALTNRELVARRRRIEEVVESRRARSVTSDYDFDLGD
ncbi:MAG: hypothetical protein ACLGHG_06330 [Gammaproteobacteria bacterium]